LWLFGSWGVWLMGFDFEDVLALMEDADVVVRLNFFEEGNVAVIRRY
jgi:hypothetical protein